MLFISVFFYLQATIGVLMAAQSLSGQRLNYTQNPHKQSCLISDLQITAVIKAWVETNPDEDNIRQSQTDALALVPMMLLKIFHHVR